MRVTLYAYACSPEAGSEPGAGWAWACAAAAAGYDVTLVTDSAHLAEWTDADIRERSGVAQVIRVTTAVDKISLTSRARHARYAAWVASAARLAAQVDDPVQHHLTYASDWMPSPAFWAPAQARVVWGPVGGGTYPPPSLLEHLPRPARTREAVRRVATTTIRRSTRRMALARVDVVLAMNADTARLFSGHPRVIIEPNVVVEPPLRTGDKSSGGTRNKAIFAGRLLDMKGLHLAIQALAEPAARAWTLDIYGDGPARQRLENLRRELNLHGRVAFHGTVPRQTVADAMGRADALVFPSFHDSASWTVAEAVTIGLPVVCLDIGGPPVIAAANAHVVPLGDNIVSRLAEALAGLPADSATAASDRWSPSRLPAVLRWAYEDVPMEASETRG